MKSSFLSKSSLRLGGVIVVCAAALAGCSERREGFTRQPTIPAKGHVNYKNKPAAGAIVTFKRASGADPTLPGAQGIVDDTGAYELTTYSTKDGVIAGEYNVSVLWPDRPDWWNVDAELAQQDKLKGKYATGQSKIVRNVKEGDTEIELIELD